MRIGLITNMMDSENAGIKRYTENLVKNLLLIDKENEYFLIHSNKTKYHFRGNYKEVRLPFFDSIPKKLITGTFVFERICKGYNLDILHDLGQISPFFFKSKTKKILTIFDLSPIIQPQFFTALTTTYTKLFPLVLRNTDHIVTISKNSKTDIKKIFNISEEKITVIYLGIEEKFRAITDKEKLHKIRKKYNLPSKFILFVGTIEPRKNLTCLISAFSNIEKRLDLKLVIVGNKGWKYKEVFNSIKQLKVQEDVIFTGFVDDEDLPLIYNLAELFVYPSFYEGFGFPILEAMSCGCPVITSSISSLSEINGDAALLVNPSSEKDLAKTLKFIVLNSKVKIKMKKNGLKHAKKFSWEICARKTLKVYEEIHEGI